MNRRYTKEWKRKVVESVKMRKRKPSAKKNKAYCPSLQEVMDLWAECK